VYAATFEQRSRRAIVRGLPSSRRSPSRTVPVLPVELVARDGATLTCAFTRNERGDAGSCLSPDGRGYRLIARGEPADSSDPPPG
jgi:hypothetical protein